MNPGIGALATAAANKEKASKKTTESPFSGIDFNNLPKKPKIPSAYNYYIVEQFKQMKEKDPAMKLKDVTKQLGPVWKQMSDKEKSKYEDAVTKLTHKMRNNTEEYKQLMNKRFTLEEVADFLKTYEKTKKRKTGRISGYSLFMRQQIRGSTGKPDLATLAGRWRELSDSEKERYNEKARKESETGVKEML